jgi:CHAD domain-containing protein
MARSVQSEREFKLAVDRDLELPDLATLDGLSAERLETRTVTAGYWDTADLRLLGWGCTLRHRDDQGWCAKLAAESGGGMLERTEVVVGGGDEPPPEIIGLLAGYLRGAELRPVARLVTERCVFGLTDERGERLGVLTDDAVRASGAHVTEPFFRELEVEIEGSGTPATVEPLVAALRDAGADDGDPQPKLVRALGAESVPAPELTVPPTAGRPTGREIIHAALASSTIHLLTHLPIAWLGFDPEGVHQVRVAMRRLRADLGTFGVLIDRTVADGLSTELAWLGRVFGEVRDADVMSERLAALGAEHDEIGAAGLAILMDVLEDHRQQKRGEARDAVTSDRAFALLDRLVEVAQDPPTAPQADDSADEVFEAAVRRRLRQIRKAIGRIDRESPDRDLHDLRKRAKKLRYAAEAAEPALGRPARRLAKAAARIQSRLGDLNDAVVGTALLAALAAREPRVAFTAGQLSGLLIAQGQQVRDEWQGDAKRLKRRAKEWSG